MFLFKFEKNKQTKTDRWNRSAPKNCPGEAGFCASPSPSREAVRLSLASPKDAGRWRNSGREWPLNERGFLLHYLNYLCYFEYFFFAFLEKNTKVGIKNIYYLMYKCEMDPRDENYEFVRQIYK